MTEANEENWENHILNQYLDDQDEDEDNNTFEPDYFDYRAVTRRKYS